MRRHLQRGFTMVEMMVVLVILGILAAIAVPNLTAYIHLSQFRKNESVAKSMYLSAESSLTYRSTGGGWDLLKKEIEAAGVHHASGSLPGNLYALRLDAGEYSSSAISADGQLVVDLLEQDTYDKSMLNEAICVEVDVQTGRVYSVFYGTNCDGLRYGDEAAPDGGVWLNLDQRDYDTRRAERLGYYSTQDTANVVDLELTKLKITSISLVNSETLTLNWSTNSKHNDEDVRFTIKLYEKASKQELLALDLARPSGGAQVEAAVTGVGVGTKDYTFPLSYSQDGRFTLTLDAMMTAAQLEGLAQNTNNPAVAKSSSTSITRFSQLAQDKEIYATVQAFPDTTKNLGGDYTASNATESNAAHTLYADGSKPEEALLTTFRHLSNVRYGQGIAAFTVSARSLDWNSDNIVLYRTENQAGTLAVLTPVKSSAVGFPTIPELQSGQTLNGSGGLLSRLTSVFTGGNTISNLTLNESSVGSSARYLGLFGQNHGTITGVQLTNAVVSADSDTLLGVGALCGQSDGKLSDSSCNVKLNATLTNPSAEGIGGVAGKVALKTGAGKAEKLSASGEVTGRLTGGTNQSGIGGVAGATIATNTMADCTNTANVTGNLRVGGVTGYVQGTQGVATSVAAMKDCANEGLILASDEDGQYIGGIAGYGDKAALESCTSRAGYGSYTYQAGDQDKLQGHYVGGILGYGNQSIVRNSATQAGGYVLGGAYVGGIVGGMDGRAGDAITSLTVTTNASYVIGQRYVGGIVGVNQGKSIINNCINTGVAAGYGEYIGGICGANETTSSGTPTILNCASYVSDTHNAIYNMVVGWQAVGSYAGGLTGYNSGIITFNNTDNKVTTRSVAGIVVGKDYVGGLVGFNDVGGTIDVSYTLIGGRVAATGDCVGGLIGLNAAPALLSQDLTVQPGSVQGRYYVGGAIGANVVNLTQDTALTGLTVNNSLGTVTAEAFCGGLIGYQRTYGNGQTNGTAQSLRALLPGVDTANGNVPTAVTPSTNAYTLTISGRDNASLTRASNNMTIRAYAYAGGIVGTCEDSSKLLLKDCLNAGGFDQPAAGTFPHSALAQGVDVVRYLDHQGYREAAAALRAELNQDSKTALRVSIVGGVMGVNGTDHVIDHCDNTGVMNGQTAMGGVVGLNEGLVTGCALSGSMGSATQDYVGGIAGLNVGGKTAGNKTYEALTYQAGTITACVTEPIRTVTGRNTVGGIVGYNMHGGTVQDNTSNANVTGADRVGGIAGENGGTVYLAGTATTATRAVTGSGQGVGGILGVNTATGTLAAAQSDGDAVVTDQTLTVTGQAKVGGIAGINRGQLGGGEGHSLTNRAKLVRATLDMAGGVVGAQEGTGGQAAALAYAKNLGQVIANKGAAGGIVGQNGAGYTVSNCVNCGDVTSNGGYAGGVVSENYGLVSHCTVDGTEKITLTQRGQSAQGAVCAVNHTTGTVTDSNLIGNKISLTGEATILGAIVGRNTGTVSNTTVSQQPNYDVSASALTVGGAVGLNTEGGVVDGVHVTSDFQKFSTYRYLGGVVGENAQALTQGTETRPTTVTNCTYSGTIDESKSAVGNCYGGIAGLNEGTLTGNTVSQLKITAVGVYTATSTSTAAQKEALSSHIGGIAGKNETTGTIDSCYIAGDASKTSSIQVQNGMVGGVTGYNKGNITYSGDADTKPLMNNVTKVSQLLSNAQAQNLAADATYVGWKNSAQVEDLTYSNGTSVTQNRTMQIIVSSNGNLGGLAGYNAPTGAMSHCASGNWFLLNKSESIGVGTGGIIGMNETEKDLTFLLNRAFVGRQIANGQTNRFAGGIIGNQNNSTTSSWLIKGCVNYGTVYNYNSHYSGGIIGQWTSNGGTVEGCYNYGNLQTTYAAGWVGAAGGIVAQLYHATSNQDFNIISCQNHGSIYGQTGDNKNNCANDSAGILGNITAYRADNGSGAKYTINVDDCVNGPGVKINSASMASAIVGFFSTDDIATNEGNGTAGPKIGKATQNIVLNIDRCRNYAQALNGNSRFQGGIFGDRYIPSAGGNTTTVSNNTYIHNCFSVNSGNAKQEIVSSGNNQGYSINDSVLNAANNYYFLNAWGMSSSNQNASVGINSNDADSRRGGSREIRFADLNGKILAIRGGPEFEDDINKTGNVQKYDKLTEKNTKVQENGDLLSQYNGKDTITGHVLFQIDKTGAYQNFLGTYQSNANAFRSALYTKNGALSDMDNYVRTYYREFEHKASNGELGTMDSVKLTQNQDGSFDVEITDNNRPLYYEGEVCIDGETVMTNLRFIPRDKEQGLWNSTYTGTDNGTYSKGTTVGTFTLPESLRKSTAGKTVTLKLRAVSQFEDTAPSEWVSQKITNTEFLPTPDVRIQLVQAGTGYQYRYSLNNLEDFQGFQGWQVALSMLGSNNTLTLSAGRTTVTATGQGLKELTATATAPGKEAVTVRQATYTPDGGRPDAKINAPAVSVSGNTLEDLVISADLTVQGTNAKVDTPPIYRVELLGKQNGQDIVFAYEDVLVSASGAATANFRNLPAAIFEGTTNLQVRAWYAMSGLGPVYTYHEAQGTESHNVTIREADGTYSYLYSTVLDNSTYFSEYIQTTNLDLTPLSAPVLSPAAVESTENGSLFYTFSWDQQGTSLNNGARYTVRLMGVTGDGSQVGISTNEVYTDDMKHEFKINADDWKYSRVILTVTRVGSGNQIGLSASREYAVSQRLERPGQPVVSNPDTNELFYDISWAALADETGCGSYQLIVAAADGSTKQLALVSANGQASYSAYVNLEDYAGQQITLYLIAKGTGVGYADSPNGVSYTMTVPTRVGTPHVSWATNFSYDGTGAVSVARFQGGGLTVSVTPQDGSSIPPGGSTYLLRAAVYADETCTQKLADYPSAGQVSAMAANGGSYTLELSGLSADYAGKWIRFETRISSAAGQVSSAWVTSGAYRLPRVQLDAPVTAMDYRDVATDVTVTTRPDIPGELQSWATRRTLITWPLGKYADQLLLTLTQTDGGQESTTQLRLTIGADQRLESVEKWRENAWETLTNNQGAYYHLTTGKRSGRYTPVGGQEMPYEFALDTLLRQESDGSFTLILPNCSTLTTADQQVLTVGQTLVTKVTLQSCSTEQSAYADSAARELAFGN